MSFSAPRDIAWPRTSWSSPAERRTRGSLLASPAQQAPPAALPERRAPPQAGQDPCRREAAPAAELGAGHAAKQVHGRGALGRPAPPHGPSGLRDPRGVHRTSAKPAAPAASRGSPPTTCARPPRRTRRGGGFRHARWPTSSAMPGSRSPRTSILAGGLPAGGQRTRWRRRSVTPGRTKSMSKASVAAWDRSAIWPLTCEDGSRDWTRTSNPSVHARAAYPFSGSLEMCGWPARLSNWRCSSPANETGRFSVKSMG